MKKLIAKASNFIAVVAVLLALSIAPKVLAAGKTVMLEGTFQGAFCTHYNKKCYTDDAHVALENDFVLVLPNGKHYFLPNLRRGIKARHAGQTVRVRGELDGHEIWVEKLNVKKGNTYQNVWDRTEQKKLYEMR